MSSWAALARELDAWQASGARATLWWRDDDASRDTPALQRLLGLAGAHAVPLTLAVVPARLDPHLATTLAHAATTTVVQHGYAHANHAAPGGRGAELGPERQSGAVLAELEQGRHRLEAAFGARFAPVLVPPWNRIDARLVPALPQVGFGGLSTFGPRATASPAEALVQCNSHVDVIAWRSGRGFIGSERGLARVIEHLEARRSGSVDASEATGILTHHLDLGDDAWTFIDALLGRTRTHPAVAWLDARALFASGRPAGAGHLRPISMNRV